MDLENLMKNENQKILKHLVSLDTPGKATVEVIILADPVSVQSCTCFLSICSVLQIWHFCEIASILVTTLPTLSSFVRPSSF